MIKDYKITIDTHWRSVQWNGTLR